MPEATNPTHDERMDDSSSEEEEEEEDLGPLPLKFRNYMPVDERLKSCVLPQPDLINVVEEIELKLQKAMEENRTRDVLNLAPRKANWDLKRDLEKKMQLLEGRTQRAIVQLVRQKLQAQGDTQSLEKKVDAIYRTEMSS